MSERARRRAFRGAALLLAAAALAAALQQRNPEIAERGSEAGTLATGDSATAVTAPIDSDRSRSTRGRNLNREAARRQARRFLHAFLRYQTGRASGHEFAALGATTTPRVRDYLLAEAPRGNTRRARLAALHIYGPRAGQMKASAELAYGGHGRKLFEFVVARRGQAWRVAELYP